MRRRSGALLIAVGLAVPTLVVWQTFATRYMEENYAGFGPRAFAGIIVSGLICVVLGIALWIVPRARR
jgi:hypothetical protein